MKIMVNSDVKKIADYYDTLSAEDKKAFMAIIDGAITLKKEKKDGKKEN